MISRRNQLIIGAVLFSSILGLMLNLLADYLKPLFDQAKWAALGITVLAFIVSVNFAIKMDSPPDKHNQNSAPINTGNVGGNQVGGNFNQNSGVIIFAIIIAFLAFVLVLFLSKNNLNTREVTPPVPAQMTPSLTPKLFARTVTPVAIVEPTPAFTASNTPTSLLASTSSPTPTFTPTPTRTFTPTARPLPTRTRTPTPTSTPIPATATPASSGGTTPSEQMCYRESYDQNNNPIKEPCTCGTPGCS